MRGSGSEIYKLQFTIYDLQEIPRWQDIRWRMKSPSRTVRPPYRRWRYGEDAARGTVATPGLALQVQTDGGITAGGGTPSSD